MDTTSYLLFDKIRSGAEVKEILFILFLLPLIPFFTTGIKVIIEYIYKDIIQKINKIKQKEEINIFFLKTYSQHHGWVY